MENNLIDVAPNRWKEIADDLGIDVDRLTSIKKEKDKPYLHIEDSSSSSIFFYPYNLGLD